MFDFIKDPEWRETPAELKQKILDLAFQDDIASDPEWQSTAPETQQRIKSLYIQDALELEAEIYPALSVAKEPDAEDTGTTGGDYARSLAMGLNRFGQTIGRGVDVLGNIDPTRLLTESGEGLVDRAGQAIESFYKSKEQEDYEALSPAMKAAKQLRYTEDNPAPWGEDPIGNVKSLFSGDAWKSPAKIAGSLLESAPVTIAGMGTGATITGGLLNTTLVTSGKISAGVAGMIGGVIGEGSVASIESGKEVYDMVVSAPYEVISKTPEYQRVIQGLAGEDLTAQEKDLKARELVADHAAMKTMAVVFAGTGLFGSVSGHYMGKIIGGEASGGLLRRAGTAGGLEILQESPQSMLEKFESNVQTKKFKDPNLSIWDGVAEAGVEGGVQGGIMGFGMGGGASVLSKPRIDPTETPQDIKNAPTADEAIAKFQEGIDTTIKQNETTESLQAEISAMADIVPDQIITDNIQKKAAEFVSDGIDAVKAQELASNFINAERDTITSDIGAGTFVPPETLKRYPDLIPEGQQIQSAPAKPAAKVWTQEEVDKLSPPALMKAAQEIGITDIENKKPKEIRAEIVAAQNVEAAPTNVKESTLKLSPSKVVAHIDASTTAKLDLSRIKRKLERRLFMSRHWPPSRAST